MALPTRTEALSLLVSVSPSPRLLQHVTVVAEVAAFLALRASQVGLSVDRRLVETAALLHDIDKALPSDHPVRELGHGHAGAAWLSEAGHPELARAIAAHPVMRLNDPGAEEWIVDAPLEERLVTYADKRGTQRVVSLEKRFARWRRKHPSYRDRLDSAFVMASRLEQSVCAALGLEPGEVERLRWVDDALVRATAAGFIDMDAIMATPALTSADASGDRPAPA